MSDQPDQLLPDEFERWWDENFARYTAQDASWDEAKRCALGAWFAGAAAERMADQPDQLPR